MQLYNGITPTTGNIRITKDVGEFCLVLEQSSFDALKNITISAVIERQSGGNKYILTKRPLFMVALLVNQGFPFLSGKADGSEPVAQLVRIHFDLGINANIPLRDGDVLVLSFEGLPTTSTTLYALDDTTAIERIPVIEVKNMLLQSTESRYSVHPDDEFIVIHGNINRLKLQTDDGKNLAYSKDELLIIQNDIVPNIGKTLMQSHQADDYRVLVDTSLENFYENVFLIPVLGLSHFEISKNQEIAVDIYSLRYEPLDPSPVRPSFATADQIKRTR